MIENYSFNDINYDSFDEFTNQNTDQNTKKSKKKGKDTKIDKNQSIPIIVNSIDDETNLDVIAKKLMITENELLDDILLLINHGLTLNIDYYIKQVISEESLNSILESIKENPNMTNNDEIKSRNIKLVKIYKHIHKL